MNYYVNVNLVKNIMSSTVKKYPIHNNGLKSHFVRNSFKLNT